MAKKNILILGAGLAGLSAAWHLHNQGIDCQILEKEPEAGGLCRSRNINGFTFDCDGHLLHFKHHYTFNLVKGLLRGNLTSHRRRSWIYSHSRYTRYPFQANLYGLPSQIVKECLLSFLKASQTQVSEIKKRENFLTWTKHTFGEGIARHFMIPYNRKFWTIPPEDLTCEWLDGFVPVPSLNDLVNGTIKESKKQFGYNAHFWYPKKGGIASLVKALERPLEEIRTNCEVTGIDLGKREVHLASGERERFDCLVSTIPLPRMSRIISGLPQDIKHFFGLLRWNSVFNLNLGVKNKTSPSRHWVYFPGKELIFFRVGFAHNFSSHNAPSGQGSLYTEVSYPSEKAIDKNKLIRRIKEDLKRIGIINREDQICCQDVNDIKYGYPIYDKNYRQSRAKITEYLLMNGVISCGRYGSWRYMSMEDAILDGRIAAERIAEII
ncbi:MAG: FAD-dependent oxidoreductase [Candidatus Omnitrophota bacterium]